MSMHNEHQFTMHSVGSDDAPALMRVEAQGLLDGALLGLTLRQTYRNTGPTPLEVVYTFPLPHGAVLLGMAAEFGDRRLQGQVLPAQQAEEGYEQALGQGDAPVLLQRTAEGLHTANLGNLLPGEAVTLELRFAQLVAFEQGSLRLSIPTTIAPRYGQAQAAGLQPQQVPSSSIWVTYPLAISLTVRGSLARGEMTCPTHPHRLERLGADLRLTLAEGATMDRDVVVRITPAEPVPDLLMRAQDAASSAAPQVMLAAFAMPPRPARQPAVLRLLVDCSGSMAGAGIHWARHALHGLIEGLNGDDEVSLSRFGYTVQHTVGAAPAVGEHLQRLRRAIDETDASMGGTEMQAALEAVFSAWPRPGTGADVLMITDGGVWPADALVAAARRSGHRVFVIGVGAAPVESVLRQLADATGGAVEFAAPGESLALAATRMLARIRQVPTRTLRVDWGATPVWQWPIPLQAFGGDGVLVGAGFAAQAAPGGPVRLLAAAAGGGEQVLATTAAHAPSDGQDLARILAARRLADLAANQADEARQMALDYQLVSQATNYLLVHERAAAGQPLVQPRLQTVAQMLPANLGAPATLQHASAEAAAIRLMMSVPRFAAMAAPFGHAGRPRSPLDPAVDPGLMAPAPAPVAMGLDAVALAVADLLAAGRPVGDLVAEGQRWHVEPALRRAVDQATQSGVGRAHVWLLLALWVAPNSRLARDPAALQILAQHAVGIDLAERQIAFAVFTQHLGERDPTDHSARRQARLIKTMARQPGH